MIRQLSRLALAGALLVAPLAHAGVDVFTDKGLFLATTGATPATEAYPLNPWPAPAITTLASGNLTLTAPAGMYVGDYSIRLPGGVISINDREHLAVEFAAPVQAFGFDFVEPENDAQVNAPFVDSTFTVTLLNGAAVVGSFQFNAPNDQATFFGVRSSVAFDRVSIIETVGDIENEFYGQFYSVSPAQPVPEPASLALLLSGLGLVGFAARRAA